MRRPRYTTFTATSIPHVRVDALCFGAPAHSYRHRGRTVYQFLPGQQFGVVWWRRYAEDRQHRTVAIVQALKTNQGGHQLPGIQRAVAVHAIVDQHGPAGQDGAADLLLDLIQDLELRWQKPEPLPASFWAEACIHVLLNRLPCSGGKGAKCDLKMAGSGGRESI